MVRRVLIVTAVLAVGAVRAAPALADHSPANCNANGLALSIDRDKQTVRNGDTINYGIYVRNDDLPSSCDITDATITFAGPGPDGEPSSSPVTVATHQSYKGGSGQVFVGTVPWKIAVDPSKLKPGQTSLTAEAVADGTLHDIDNALDNAHITKTLGTQALPSISLTKTGSTRGGQAPQTVTYTYTVKNTSGVVATISKVILTDNLCSPVTYTGGDANRDGLIQTTETWTYTCKRTYTAAGCYTNVANVTGTGTVGNTPSPVGAGPVTWTVCETAPPPPSTPPSPPAPPKASPPPPPPPKAAVKGASASKCVTLPTKHLKVRARELTTVKVRVRLNGKNIAKSLVHVSGAGVKKSGRTNKKGMITFHVRPKKSGRLTVRSDQCAVAARVSVKPARQVVSPALPEVTG